MKVLWRSLGIVGDWAVPTIWSGQDVGSFSEDYARDVFSHEVLLLWLSKMRNITNDKPIQSFFLAPKNDFNI